LLAVVHFPAERIRGPVQQQISEEIGITVNPATVLAGTAFLTGCLHRPVPPSLRHAFVILDTRHDEFVVIIPALESGQFFWQQLRELGYRLPFAAVPAQFIIQTNPSKQYIT